MLTKMKISLSSLLVLGSASAALAIGGLLASSSAHADIATGMAYVAGGPVKQGNMCQISTDPIKAYGFWKPCPNTSVRSAKHSARR
jgi:hypothetical protein